MDPGKFHDEYSDDVSKQDYEDWAAWVEEQSEGAEEEALRKNDGSDEGDTHFDRWLKDKKNASKLNQF